MKFVVVGGGTAGWLSALFIKRLLKKEVTLIEPGPSSGIGVGEGSTALLHSVIANPDFGLNTDEFIRQTKSTPKLGIDFIGWSDKDFFSPIDGSITSGFSPDFATLHMIANNRPASDASRMARLIKSKKLPINKNWKFPQDGGMAWHFSALDLANFLRESLRKEITLITGTVDEFTVSERAFIKSVRVDQKEVFGDFFIDASGYRKVLGDKRDQEVDHSKYLPANKAVTFTHENTDILNTKPVTKCHAMDAGWAWQIPVGNRYGCGYVFCDSFITNSDAGEEVFKKWGGEKGVVLDRVIDFRAHHIKEPWQDNVLKIGFSAGFLEPLQATAIHTVIASLAMFTTQNFSENHTQATRDAYNKKVNDLMYSLVDFISLHYQTTSETKTKFWKYMKQHPTESVVDTLDICSCKLPDRHDLPLFQFCAGLALWAPILDGLGWISPQVARNQLETSHADPSAFDPLMAELAFSPQFECLEDTKSYFEKFIV